MSEPVLTLEGVHVHVPRRADPVLRGVDLQVAPREHVLLLGPSGSGKSTLVQCLTGVIPRSVAARLDGHVTVAGASTKDSSVVELSRHVGVLAQDPAAAVCLPHVTHELALPLENHATDPASIGSRVDAALGAVGAAHLRDRRTGKLSGGETQRVALAAALVTEPEVLVLDEPTSMLDPAGVRAVRDALAAVTTRKGPAVVLVEHRLDELAGDEGLGGLPARTLVLAEDGSVMADGPTRDVLHRHGRALLRAGCWLPLESELRALTGADGGLSATKNQELLLHLATASRPRPDDLLDEPVRFGPPVLRARSLAVSGQDERRRRRSPGGPPPLLTGVDVEVRAGEVLAVLGPNGAGKSSLLLTLAGLRAPAGGTVEGERAGMVFQNPEHQMVASTVAEEIAHGLGADRAGHRDIDAIVARQLREHRLTHLAHQNPFRLSGGEKRRVSLAAMLAHERPCLLADEPTLGLDRRDTLATIATLRRAARAGHGVVIVSHDLRTVAALADTVLVLAEGGVAAYGLTVEVLRDAHVLRRAGLTLPGVLAWLLEHVADPAGVRRALRELDATVPLPDPQLAGVAG